jgi:hypothetical protein
MTGKRLYTLIAAISKAMHTVCASSLTIATGRGNLICHSVQKSLTGRGLRSVAGFDAVRETVDALQRRGNSRRFTKLWLDPFPELARGLVSTRALKPVCLSSQKKPRNLLQFATYAIMIPKTNFTQRAAGNHCTIHRRASGAGTASN